MRPEKLYLTDIVEAAQSIERFLTDADFNEFEQNDMMNSAVLQKLTVIGEAAAHLPKEFTKRFHDIPWLDIAWVAATEEVPALKEQVAQILQQEFQD